MLTKTFLKSPSLAAFQTILQSEGSLLMEHLWEGAKAALLLLARDAGKKNILIITGGVRENRLLDNLSFFQLSGVHEFPSWETLPGEEISPSPDIVGKRFEILNHLLSNKEPQIVLTTLQAALQKLLPRSQLSPLCKEWKKGDTVPFFSLEQHLSALGYRRAAVVADKGEFALRGGILDLFPLSSLEPVRVDFFGDTIDDIRIFDPIGQKSISKIPSFFLGPSGELDLLKKEERLETLLDYLGPETIVIFDDLLALEDRYVALKQMDGFRTRFFLTFEEFMKSLKNHQLILWSEHTVETLGEVKKGKLTGRSFYTGKTPLQELSFELLEHTLKTKRWQHPFREISDFFSPYENQEAATPQEILQSFNRFAPSALELHLIFDSDQEEKKFLEEIKNENSALPASTEFHRGYLTSGFVIADSNVAILPMTELTRRYKTRRQKWRNTYHTPASEFHELSPGDIVVHFHNGIGRYLGVEKRKNHLGQETEFMMIEYAEESKLYVPIAQSHLVSRYIGAKEETPVFNTIGTQRWQKAKAQAQKAIIGYAEQIIRFAAEREIKGGFLFPEDGEDMASFENEFPFQETEDQLQAIAAIKQDMMSPGAMDRLICGDVGYGKTEVAMRAAFKAVADGKKQVALLVPTTVLAMQHYETFCARMANFPIQIGVLSRFKSPKEIKETLQKLAAGTIDIVVGTHRLISKDVKFHDLGLLIIDEEQRFGVRAKEHLKNLKIGVDCLTLSATPIPRTLYLSLMGAKAVSIINTPPHDRLPIKSVLVEKDSSVIQNALLREFSRDGQAFFIHNRVETIFQTAGELQKLAPQARIVVAHGQMAPDEIDAVFHSFKSGDADVLVATTIIENGIDIPNANTILIDRADQYGLADLYQLRGRVGRWNRPSYAYFLTPLKKSLPEIVKRRLHVLLEASGYGGGMKIAMRDLEIRGAGDILGTEQSGQISSIGFHLYCKLLKRTIDALKKKIAPTFSETKMEFGFDARIPEEYIDAASLRLEIYHRFGEATEPAEIDALVSELKDRFGEPPVPVLWLFHLTKLRILASANHFNVLKFNTLTLYAEQMKGKSEIKKTLAIPSIKKPIDIEQKVIPLLKQTFQL